MSAPSPEAARRIYRIMANVAACDGSVADAERQVLDAARERFGLAADAAQALEAEGAAGEGLEIGAAPEERALLITSMVDVVIADGRVDSAERTRLVRVAKEIGLTREELTEQLIPRLS